MSEVSESLQVIVLICELHIYLKRNHNVYKVWQNKDLTDLCSNPLCIVHLSYCVQKVQHVYSVAWQHSRRNIPSPFPNAMGVLHGKGTFLDVKADLTRMSFHLCHQCFPQHFGWRKLIIRHSFGILQTIRRSHRAITLDTFDCREELRAKVSAMCPAVISAIPCDKW